jgi:hypothetical protein
VAPTTDAERALRCGPVRPTPLYDQLRGERINADVPPSDAPLHQGEDRGKHRLADAELSSATVGTQPSLAAADHPNTDLPPHEADSHQPAPPVKHYLPDSEPGLAPSLTAPSAAADQLANWSWFATAEPTDPAPVCPQRCSQHEGASLSS